MTLDTDSTLREDVRQLVDEIPENELPAARQFLRFLRAEENRWHDDATKPPSFGDLITGDALAPITLTEVTFEGKTLRFKEPMTVHPFFDKEYDLMFVEIPEMGIMSGGITREALITDLHEDICLRWYHYGTNDDPTLTGDAAMIRDSARRWLEEVS